MIGLKSELNVCLGKEILEAKCDTLEGKVAGDEGGRKEGRKERMDTAKGKKRGHESRAVGAFRFCRARSSLGPWC